MEISGIRIEKNPNPKTKPNESNMGFGKHLTDHMFVWDYEEGIGWKTPTIVPYGPLGLSPAALVLHYGQEIFEGMKAYRSPEGKILLFRPSMNLARLNRSAERMCMPQADEEMLLRCLEVFVSLDRDWVPHQPEASLYIRPFMIATDDQLGVRVSDKYKLIIVAAPGIAYYTSGLEAVPIYIEEEYIRAAPGGTGAIKCGGNYGATLKSQAEAKKKGFSQVLWLDGVERKYVEECGTMNVMFVIDGEVVTPPAEGTILPGVTRDSAVQLFKSWGIPVRERKIALDEVMDGLASGKLSEAFGVGTAAVISPIGEFGRKNERYIVGDGKMGPMAKKLYDGLTGIQWGRLPDPFGWTMEVEEIDF